MCSCGHNHECGCNALPSPEYTEVDIGTKTVWCKLWRTKSDIKRAIKKVARDISWDYANKENVVMLVVLKGGTFFANDLLTSVQLPFITQEYVWCSSYTVKGVPDGPPSIYFVGSPSNLAGKSVIIVDDIMDTGATIDKLHEELVRYGVRDIKTCCLVYKKADKNSIINPDYVGFEANDLTSDMYLVGYGMDYNELFRGIDDIYWFDKKSLTSDTDPNNPFTNGLNSRIVSSIEDDMMEYKKTCLHEN